jgi:hypothetical protein
MTVPPPGTHRALFSLRYYLTLQALTIDMAPIAMQRLASTRSACKIIVPRHAKTYVPRSSVVSKVTPGTSFASLVDRGAQVTSWHTGDRDANGADHQPHEHQQFQAELS